MHRVFNKKTSSQKLKDISEKINFVKISSKTKNINCQYSKIVQTMLINLMNHE